MSITRNSKSTFDCQVYVDVSNGPVHQLFAELLRPLLGADQPVLLRTPRTHNHRPSGSPACQLR